MAPWDRFEHGPRHGHRFERGDLRYVLLDLLEERPSYGYELIRALEDRFHGFYSPSPGTIYPTLQWLQDLGYVTVSEQDNRKVYTITDEGRRFLAARGARMDEIRERMAGWWGPRDREFRDEMKGMLDDLRDMAKDLRHDARWASPEKLRRVREVAERAGREISEILREPEPRPADRPADAGASAVASSGAASAASTGPAPAAPSEPPAGSAGPQPGTPEVGPREF